MKREMKGFICGAVSMALLVGGVSFAAGQWKTIDVLENDITVMVDGQQITESNFLYNDTTYLPLRAVAEAVGKPVEYDGTTNTAYIGIKPSSGNIISVKNTYQALRDSVYLYEGTDGTMYVKLKEANNVAFVIEGLTLYGINMKDENTWMYEKYDAINDVSTVLAEGPMYVDSTGEKYMKADDFINIGF